MMGGTMSKQRLVLKRDTSFPLMGLYEAFMSDEYDPMTGPAQYFSIPHLDWADMGHPDQITVTIRPGDRLNG